MRACFWFRLVRLGLIVSGVFACVVPGRAEDVRVVRIVAFGPSQTEGKLVARDQAYPAQLERLLQAGGFKVSISNAGVSGDNSRDLLQRLDSAIPDNTDIVLFQPGTNDCHRKHAISESGFRTNLTAMLEKFKERHLSVLVLGGNCYEELQAELPVSYGFTYYGRIGQGMKDFPRPDGQHYTAEGYAHMVELLAPYVKQLIQERLQP
jgi:acyl-CoA thioesterase-1